MHRGLLSTDQESGKFTRVKGKVWGSALTELDLSVLAAYQEYWALHFALKSNLAQLYETSSTGSMDRIKMALKDFKKLKTTEKNTANNGFNYRNPKEVFELTRSSFHPTRYAFQLYADNKCLPFFEKIPDAKSYFELALTYDPDFAAGASLGLAYISLLGEKKYYVIPKNARGYKDEAITNLTRCLAIFSEELCQFQSLLNHTEHEGNGDDNRLPSEYERQLRARLQVLQHYGAVVYKTLDFVKLSFRKVYLLQSNPQLSEETRFHIPLSFTKLPSSILENGGRVTLECEGLGWKKDLNFYHQAEPAIEFLRKKMDSRGKRGGQEEQTESFVTKMRLEAENVEKFFECLGQDSTTTKKVPGILKVFKDGSLILDIEFRVVHLDVAKALDLCKTKSSQDFYNVRLTSFPEDFAEPIARAFESGEGEEVQLVKCRHEQCNADGCKLELEPDLEGQEVRGRIKSGMLPTLLKVMAAIVPNANVFIEEIHLPATAMSQVSLLKGAQQVWVHIPITAALELLKVLKKIDITPRSVQFTNLAIEMVQETMEHLKLRKDPMTQVAFRPLTSLFFNFQSPTDVIQEMKMRGLHWVAAFEELDSLRPLTTALLVIQFCVELAIGGLLTSTGIGGIFAQPFYAAAVHDMGALAKSLFLRKFSWTAYCLAKPISLAFSFGLAGLELLPGDVTPGKSFLDSVLETFASFKLFEGAVGPLLLDGLSSFVAFLAGPLADYAYQEERKLISEEVRVVVAEYLEEKPEMRAHLASFCALERLEHGNELLSISSASQLQFRLWLKSAGLGVANSWTSKLLKTAEIWLTKQGIGNLTFKELTVAGILLHSARLIRYFESLEKITYEACSVIQERLWRKLLIMQDLSSVLVSHCGLSHEQVRKLGIKEGISCFSGEKHLPEDAGLDFVTDEDLSHARQRLKMLREQKSSFSQADESILLASLSDFVTDHVVGYAAKAIISSAMKAPRREQANSALRTAQEPHCVVITSQNASGHPLPPVVSTFAEESRQQSQAVLKELMHFCKGDVGPFNPTLQSSVLEKPAAIQLAKAIFYSWFTGRKISVVEDSSDPCSTSPGLSSSTLNPPVLLFQLNDERTEVVCARLEGNEKIFGKDCLLHALGKRSGSVVIENYLAFNRLGWLIDHLISFAPSLSSTLDQPEVIAETPNI